MPQEFSRTTARKKILLPSGDTIYVPVITKISFIDPYDRYQETEHNIDNTIDSGRVVHVDKVSPVLVDKDGVPTEDEPTAVTSQQLFVERIDTWPAVDPFDRNQETRLTLDNVTGNDLVPPHFSNHQRTHIYRYYKDPTNPDDNGVWVDSELIDEFSVIDPYERSQETHYILVNPTNAEFRDGDLSGQASTDDPDITKGDGDGEGPEENPVRLDPFQNIVNFSGGYIIVIKWGWGDYYYTNIAGIGSVDSSYIEHCHDVGGLPTVDTRFYHYTITPHDAVAGSDVTNDSSVTPQDNQDSVTWLNSETITDGVIVSEAGGRQGVTGPPSAVTVDATVPPDAVPAMPIDFFIAGPLSPLVLVGPNIHDYEVTQYFQTTGGNGGGESGGSSNTIGDIKFDITSTRSVPSEDGGVSYTGTFFNSFCAPPSEETFTDTWDSVHEIVGAPGIGGFTAKVYSLAEVHWDEETQQLLPNPPATTLPDPLCTTRAGGSVSAPGGTTNTAWSSGVTILRLAVKQIPDPDNPGELLAVPIIWPQSPSSYMTYDSGTGGMVPLGHYDWVPRNGDGNTTTIAFGTPP